MLLIRSSHSHGRIRSRGRIHSHHIHGRSIRSRAHIRIHHSRIHDRIHGHSIRSRARPQHQQISCRSSHGSRHIHHGIHHSRNLRSILYGVQPRHQQWARPQHQQTSCRSIRSRDHIRSHHSRIHDRIHGHSIHSQAQHQR